VQVAIDHVAAFDWPRERLIVQICDDSEDQVRLASLHLTAGRITARQFD
jgi:hypothetical protein